VSGLTLDEDPGNRLPTTAKSREDMLPDIPRALPKIPADLREMILGEDA
jgi:hypothetical protein